MIFNLRYNKYLNLNYVDETSRNINIRETFPSINAAKRILFQQEGHQNEAEIFPKSCTFKLVIRIAINWHIYDIGILTRNCYAWQNTARNVAVHWESRDYFHTWDKTFLSLIKLRVRWNVYIYIYVYYIYIYIVNTSV